MNELNLAAASSRIAARIASASDETTRRIDLGGRCLELTSSGNGSPTVVLETGLGAESAEWSVVQRTIAPLTRVLRYDRACRGASDPAPHPRTAIELVDDLAQLLHRAAVPPPYLLVGHSLGGLLMRLFADRHRSEVAGLILVDSMHEDQFDIFGPTFPPAVPGEPQALTETRAFWNGGWRDPRSTTEGLDLVATCAQGRAVTTLGDLPLHVLVAGTFLNQPLIPKAMRARLQQKWDELQRGFLRLSSDSSLSTIESSGHFVQRDAPQRIVGAIRQMLARFVTR